MKDRCDLKIRSKSKRTFVKLSISTLAARMFVRLSAWAASGKLTNWAGNIEYGTERLSAANTVAQVKEFVAKHSKFKVLGTRALLQSDCGQLGRVPVSASDGRCGSDRS